MANIKPVKASYEGTLPLGDKVLKVAVLSDGTRIINQTDLFNAFGRPMRGSRGQGDQGGVKLPGLIDAKNLKPFITNELESLINVIEFIDLSGRKNQGYNALVLPLICDVYLEARNAKKADGSPVLTGKQRPNADAAEVLIRALSRVGILALVDEATGYQYDRERDELQKVLSAYIAEELLPWQKRFPDEFYKEIFRLNGWDYTVGGIKKRPGVIGKWTKSLIYAKLPDGVLRELYSRTPRTSTGKLAKRLHQSLTLDVGNPHLEKQLVAVITLMNISKNWREFMRFFNKKFGQQELEFPEVEIVPEPPKPKTVFDKQLKGMLNTPPPKSKKY